MNGTNPTLKHPVQKARKPPPRVSSTQGRRALSDDARRSRPPLRRCPPAQIQTPLWCWKNCRYGCQPHAARVVTGSKSYANGRTPSRDRVALFPGHMRGPPLANRFKIEPDQQRKTQSDDNDPRYFQIPRPVRLHSETLTSQLGVGRFGTRHQCGRPSRSTWLRTLPLNPSALPPSRHLDRADQMAAGLGG
jgi:hypothetical protein